MRAQIRKSGSDILFRVTGKVRFEYRSDGDSALATFLSWSARYDSAVDQDSEAELRSIGGEMFAWLNPTGGAAQWAQSKGSRELEIRVAHCADPLSRALMQVPWELLATDEGHLADDARRPFEVFRRIGPQRASAPPRHGDLQVLFMAAAPEGQSELDFEAEEAAVIEATEHLGTHLVVEESGCLKYLLERLQADGPFEALHLSCHGTVTSDHRPVLVLEDEVGRAEYAYASDIVGIQGNSDSVPLAFLSACQTARAESGETGKRVSDPLVWDLLRAGVPNVLGWDGAVHDGDATAFAKVFYRELSVGKRVSRASAIARQALRQNGMKDPETGRHWHLARVYVGPTGGNALVNPGRPVRHLSNAAHEVQFLDATRSEVPVATRTRFVGRRREIQTILRAFRQGSVVLIHGMGNLGKSSLAARVASRLTSHRTVLIFGQYDALSMFDRLMEVIPPQSRSTVAARWQNPVSADPATLAGVMRELLAGPLKDKPILLIIDDLERILEPPTRSNERGIALREPYGRAFHAVVSAFTEVESGSRLLVTSRYRFSSPDGQGSYLAANMVEVSLRALKQTDRVKQLMAAARTWSDAGALDANADSVTAILEAARGNPGLQAALTDVLASAGPDVIHERLLEVRRFLENGEVPDGLLKAADPVGTFFRRMDFGTCTSALTEAQLAILRGICIFSDSLPIPYPALASVGSAAGENDASVAIERLISLGLVEDSGVIRGVRHACVNSLARPLAGAAHNGPVAALAAAALPELGAAWLSPHGTFAHARQALEVVRLALLVPTPDLRLLTSAATSAGLYLFTVKQDPQRALDRVVEPTLSKLEAMGERASYDFLMLSYETAERLGKTALQTVVLDMMERQNASGVERARTLLYTARRHARLGRPREAEQAYSEAATLFLEAGNNREWAMARGGIAELLETRGELDAALRIRKREELPAYKRVGDTAAVATVWAEIAGILLRTGRPDDAFQILESQVLTTFERLNDVRSIAVTWGRVADVLTTQGDLDKARRIRERHELPGYETVSDVRLIAGAWGEIAELAMAQGRLEESSSIRKQHQMPIYRKLKDTYQRAKVAGKIAHILHLQGRGHQAIRLLLPVIAALRRAEDWHEEALAWGTVAEVLRDQGRLEEALQMHREKELPVYERFGDVRSKAITLGNIAEILHRQGDLDGALNIHADQELPIYRRIGDLHTEYATLRQMAQILTEKGQADEAIAAHEQAMAIARRRGMLEPVAAILYAMAHLRLQRNPPKDNDADRIVDELGEAFEIAQKLGRPDMVTHLGAALVDFLRKNGRVPEALKVLERAQVVYEQHGDRENLEAIREMRRQMC